MCIMPLALPIIPDYHEHEYYRNQEPLSYSLSDGG